MEWNGMEFMTSPLAILRGDEEPCITTEVILDGACIISNVVSRLAREQYDVTARRLQRSKNLRLIKLSLELRAVLAR